MYLFCLVRFRHRHFQIQYVQKHEKPTPTYILPKLLANLKEIKKIHERICVQHEMNKLLQVRRRTIMFDMNWLLVLTKKSIANLRTS